MFGKPECDVLQPEPHSGEACNTLSHKGLSNVNMQKGMLYCHCFVCLLCCFTSQVNSYGHCGMVSSPNHTFFLGKLEQAVNQYFVHILSLVTDNNPS